MCLCDKIHQYHNHSTIFWKKISLDLSVNICNQKHYLLGKGIAYFQKLENRIYSFFLVDDHCNNFVISKLYFFSELHTGCKLIFRNELREKL